ncbi:MAG: lamin tail domain-containing protein, partial [Fidelibacterota bacterium]
MWVGLIVILHSALAGLLLGQPCPPPDTLEVTPPQDLWTVEYWNDWKGIELVTWNIEHFPMEGITTINSVAEVTLDMMSDIYALQEIDDSLAFKDQLMPLIHSYGYVLSTGSTNTNLAILYRKDVLVVTGTEELWEETSASPDDDDDYTNNALYYFAGRPPLKVDFQWGCGRRAVNFSVINVHLKCCDALERRRISAQLLRTYLLDRMAQGDSNMVVLGDWNDDLVDASPDDAFSAFLLDSTNFRFVTLPLAADTSDYYDSYPGWPSFLDHILISRGLFDEDQEASVTTFRLDDVMGDYYETILSDHRPVGWKFQVPAGASPYSVVINEIMQNPLAVSDPVGEWFELYSTDTGAIDLQGWTIRDEGLDQHVISSDEEIVLDPGAYLVMGRSGDGSINGGVETDYVYSSFTLGNGGDEIILLDEEGAEVDRVEYDGGPDFPDPAGASMALRDPISDNNVGSNWVESTVPYGDGDLGTPGGFNFPYVGPVWHVTVDGSDSSGDGSRESPFQSIQHGVDTAREGDTVLVHPGTYGETIRITGKDLVVTSLFQDSGDTSYISRTIIDGDGGGSVVTFEDGVGASTYLTGFTILNGHAERGGGIHISHSDPVITNCRIV